MSLGNCTTLDSYEAELVSVRSVCTLPDTLPGLDPVENSDAALIRAIRDALAQTDAQLAQTDAQIDAVLASVLYMLLSTEDRELVDRAQLYRARRKVASVVQLEAMLYSRALTGEYAALLFTVLERNGYDDNLIPIGNMLLPPLADGLLRLVPTALVPRSSLPAMAH